MALVGDERDQHAISLLRAVAADADSFHRAWQRLRHESTPEHGLLADLQAQLDRSQRVIAALLVAEPDTTLDRPTLDDLLAWVQTGQHLTELLAALTQPTVPAQP